MRYILYVKNTLRANRRNKENLNLGSCRKRGFLKCDLRHFQGLAYILEGEFRHEEVDKMLTVKQEKFVLVRIADYDNRLKVLETLLQAVDGCRVSERKPQIPWTTNVLRTRLRVISRSGRYRTPGREITRLKKG